MPQIKDIKKTLRSAISPTHMDIPFQVLTTSFNCKQ